MPVTIDKKGTRTADRKSVLLPTTFTPRFLCDADARIAVVRTIRKRLDALKQDVGADSLQKELLCQRAVFTSLLLETAEVECLEGNGLDWGQYVQACNALSGLLARLGLSKHVKKVQDLSSYLDQKRNGTK